MSDHPLRRVIEACDRAITAADYDTLMTYYADDASLVIQPGHVVQGKTYIRQAFVAIAAHFQHKLKVTQGEMQVIEGADTALVIMETKLEFPGEGASCSKLSVERLTYFAVSQMGRGVVRSTTLMAPICSMRVQGGGGSRGFASRQMCKQYSVNAA